MDEAVTPLLLLSRSAEVSARGGGLSEPVEILALFLAEIRCVWPSLPSGADKGELNAERILTIGKSLVKLTA